MCSRFSRTSLLRNFISSHRTQTRDLTFTKHLLKQTFRENSSVSLIENDSVAPLSVPREYKNLIKIEYDDMNRNIRSAHSINDLFDILQNYNSSFEPDHLYNFIKQWSLVCSYDKSKNKFAINYSNRSELPEHVSQLLVKLTIKHAPHFEPNDTLFVLERLILLGFNSDDKCIRAVLQIMKYHINSFDFKNMLRFKANMDSLAQTGITTEITALQHGLNLAVKSKQSNIYSIKMKMTLLKEFPEAFTNQDFEFIINSLLPEWQNLLAHQRNEFTEMILDRNVINKNILRKIIKVLRKHIETKTDMLLGSTESSISEVKKFMATLQQLTVSLINENYYAKELSHDIIDYQLKILKSVDIDNKDLKEMIGRNLNTLLEFCLKFNYYSPDVLLYLNKIELNLIRKDLYVYYAGLCDFNEISKENVEVCLKYASKNQSNINILMNSLMGLYWLNKTKESCQIASYLSSTNLSHTIYPKEKSQKHKMDIENYLKELISENETAYEFEKLGNTTDDLENLVDFEILDRNTNVRCFGYIEKRGERFRNTSELSNDGLMRVKLVNSMIENRKDGSLFWYIKKSSNMPFEITIEEIDTLFANHEAYNETSNRIIIYWK